MEGEGKVLAQDQPLRRTRFSHTLIVKIEVADSAQTSIKSYEEILYRKKIHLNFRK